MIHSELDFGIYITPEHIAYLAREKIKRQPFYKGDKDE